jgi:hypothetical protein
MVQLHQLLHGYRSGHGQIAASVKLAERDSELVTRLSDLSGSLSSGIQFSSYLTVYPLPSRKFYAIARTWPDLEAPRTGCVVTHTLLIPMNVWSQLLDVRSLNALFRNPRADTTYNFSESVALPSQVDVQLQAESRINLVGAKRFVYSYFGQAMRPIIWFDADSPEEYLWRLLDHLWPKLRGAFSCCTFSLQQRTLEEGPFDLLFAPSSISARFLKLSPDHLIKGDGASNDPQLTEPWCGYWAEALFSANRGLPSGEHELPVWNELGEDPTTLRKLALIQELLSRASHSPTAGVGAIDVVESLANEPETALPLKRQVLGIAIEAAAAASPAKDGLTSLRLIDDRLRRESFKDIAKGFEGALDAAASRVTIANPEAAIEMDGTWLADSKAGTTSPYVNGVIRGLRDLASTNPGSLTVLRSRPDIAAEIFRLEPTFAATYLQVGGESAPGVLASWLATTRDTDTLRRVRKSVLPVLKRADDEMLLSPLLRDLLEAEVQISLDTLCEISGGFLEVTTRHVVADQISSIYPRLVREWASEVRRWSDGISSVVAATYAPTRYGFDELLDDGQLSSERQAGVLAAMVNDQTPGGAPYWLRELVSKDVRIVSTLLLAEPGRSESVDAALTTIVNEVPDVPIAKSAVLLEKILTLEDRQYSPQLVRAAIKSVITSYVAEGLDTPSTPLFLSSPTVARCLQQVSGTDLIDWFVQNCSNTVATARAWEWISKAPAPLYHRYPAVLADLCEALLRYSRYSFPQGAQYSLLQVLRRSRSESDADVRQALAAKSLRFAFDNVNFPLGSVVAEAFADVYAAAIQENRSPSFFSFFGSYDWDKGKDLRVAIIDAFLRSNWPPGELALAASNAGILRKIFKRLHKRSRGDDYIRAMVDNLKTWNDPAVSQLRQQLETLMSSPNFYEEWD